MEQLIAHYLHMSLPALRESLAADHEFTSGEREAIVRRATPLIEARTRQAIERAHSALQAVH